MSARRKGCALLHIRARFCRFLRKNVHFCLFYSGFPLSLLTCCGSSRTAIRGNRRPFRLAEDVDDHFVLPGREAPLPDAEVQCREACPQVAFGP